MTTTLVGVGVPAAAFFFSISGRGNNKGKFEMIFSNGGKDLLLLALALALVVNLALIGFRNIRYVVCAELDDANSRLILNVRNLMARSLTQVSIGYDRVSIAPCETLKFPGMNAYQGYQIKKEGVVVGYLLTDHFTWDDQARKVRKFMAELAGRVKQ
ncbi:MAG: hypothetical protein JSS84_04275 [Bacteroidetes bacterium]|nr:hypothetical protein [Bacteroidota bacterium]